MHMGSPERPTSELHLFAVSLSPSHPAQDGLNFGRRGQDKGLGFGPTDPQAPVNQSEKFNPTIPFLGKHNLVTASSLPCMELTTPQTGELTSSWLRAGVEDELMYRKPGQSVFDHQCRATGFAAILSELCSQ